MLDEDRAGLHAGAAGGAGPERFVDDHAADQRHARLLDQAPALPLTPDPAASRATSRLALRGDQAGPRRQNVLLQVEDQLLGRERLVGLPGRAGVLAAAALGAGVEVEDVLAAQVLRRGWRPTAPRSRCAARCP